MATVSVIIPAAGTGTRFGAGGNKVFQTLAGREVFLRSVDVFAARDDVCQILLVMSADDLDAVKRRYAADLSSLGVSLVVGGSSRTESVRNALGRVDASASLVCVHDAVRPCVSAAAVEAVLAAGAESGAAILAAPIDGTIKQVGPAGLIERTVCREGLWQAQTPQVFDRALLTEAYQRPVDGATDDAQVVEAAGHAVTVVPGDASNIKITTPGDLALAEAIIGA